jgi:hypothetical protein
MLTHGCHQIYAIRRNKQSIKKNMASQKRTKHVSLITGFAIYELIEKI